MLCASQIRLFVITCDLQLQAVKEERWSLMHTLPACEGCDEILKEEARFRAMHQNNEDNRTTEGKKPTSFTEISFFLIPVYTSGNLTTNFPATLLYCLLVLNIQT